MKTPTKFVNTLSDQEHSKLIENHQTADNFRVRNRSHAILLSSEKFPIDEIAAFVELTGIRSVCGSITGMTPARRL
jgi:hypothetical protein